MSVRLHQAARVSEPGSTPAIKVQGLGHTYPGHSAPALSDVSFEVARGEVVAVLGPSGAGKTTLFRCLTQLLAFQQGLVELAGRRLGELRGAELSVARRDVGLIFQQFNLVRRLTAEQNVLAGRLGHASTWRVLLRRFEPGDRALADEPVSSLDPASAAGVLDTLRGVAQERGITVLSSLHQVELATRFADRIVALRDGRVVLDTPTSGFDAADYASIFGQ